jgi:hypothetical protein
LINSILKLIIRLAVKFVAFWTPMAFYVNIELLIAVLLLDTSVNNRVVTNVNKGWIVFIKPRHP